jgi:hypothetical protein
MILLLTGALIVVVSIWDIATSLNKIARCMKWQVDYIRDPQRTKYRDI